MNVLLLEDEKVSRTFLEKMLQEIAVVDNIDYARDGYDAYDLILESYIAETKYDLIFLDIHVPGQDGLNVLQLIRKAEKENGKGRSVILMTSGDKSRQSIEDAIFLGCDGYLIKPYKQSLLEQQLRKFRLIP